MSAKVVLPPPHNTASSPVDVLLHRLSERASSTRVRAWAARLLSGEAATSETITPPKPATPD
jgi:hypothetical protein